MFALMVASALLVASLLAVYVHASNVSSDSNRNVSASTLKNPLAINPAAASNIAVAWIVGPGTSYDIKVNIKNLASGRIRFVSLSVLLCKTATRERLIIDGDGVFSIIPPPNGTVTVYSPNTINEVPDVVIEFTSFDNGETAQFNLDPDTFANPDYGATVSEMKGLIVQVWLEDGKTAGAATFITHSTGAVYAYIPSL